MIILATLEQASKKKFKKCNKILITDKLKEKDIEDKRAILLDTLLPDTSLFVEYMNGYISKKKYKKYYEENIFENEAQMSTFISLALLYKKYDTPLILACDAEEIEYKYLSILAEMFNERYGMKVKPCSGGIDVKENKNTFSEKGAKRLKKDVKEYRHLLEECLEDSKKSKKKKKKKDKYKSNKKKDKKKKDKHKSKKKDKKALDFVSIDKILDERFNIDNRFEVVKVKKLFKNR